MIETPGVPVVVVGAGLAGSLLATLLGRRGVTVTVYERRSDPRVHGAERGRSINLALSARGLSALREVGLEPLALDNALPMAGRMVHPVTGEAALQPYSADGTLAINSISRSKLNEALLDAAEATPGVEVVFEHRFEDLDPSSGRLTFEGPAGPVQTEASVVLGADGAFSLVRTRLAERGLLQFDIDAIDHGYKELTIPSVDGAFTLDPAALHIWARGDSMMIALPNLDRSFTCTLFWPRTGERGFDQLTTPEEIRGFFADHYADAAALMPRLVEDYQENPVGSLVTIRTWPWSAQRGEWVAGLLGDAAHGIVPFFGQGANCGFEDTLELARLYDRLGPDWPTILSRYQESRKPDTDAIAAMSLDNFIEMRDRVNSPTFRVKSAAVHAVERASRGRFRSRYEMVSFTTVPYAQISRRLRAQNLTLFGLGAAVVAAGWVTTRALRRPPA